MLLISRFARIMLLAAILVMAGVWWLERDRASHVDRPRAPDDPRAQVAAARSALREMQTAQEVFAAEHDGRYASTIDTLVALSDELARRLDRSLGVSAALQADPAGAWYAAEVGHVDLPGWACRLVSDGAPAAQSGRVEPWTQACDPIPDADSASSPSVGS